MMVVVLQRAGPRMELTHNLAFICQGMQVQAGQRCVMFKSVYTHAVEVLYSNGSWGQVNSG
jgi:hypothetical protein